jgi:anti-sigma B factor antagonist
MLQVNRLQIDPDITVLALEGRLTLGRESQRLESQVAELKSANVRKLILDLSGVDYVDSAGLGIVTFCWATIKNAGGEMRIACPEGRVLQLLRFTRMISVLPVDSTREEAARQLTEAAER